METGGKSFLDKIDGIEQRISKKWNMVFIRVDKVLGLSLGGCAWASLLNSVKIGFRTAEKLIIANREKWKAQPVMILPPALTDLSWLPDANAIGFIHGMRCLESGAMTKTDNLKRKDGHHALWSSGGRFLSAVYSLIGKRILNGHYIDVFSPSHMLYCNCLCLWEVL